METSKAKSKDSSSKAMKGKIVSTAGEKTLVVEVASYKEHKKYRKKYNSTKRYKVHYEGGEHTVGEEIEFVACRPMSKDKQFKVVA